MSHAIKWYIEKRVISVRVYGEIDKDEAGDSTARIDQLRVEGTPPIFLLLDFRDVTKHPTDMGYVINNLKAKSRNQGEIKWTIILSNNAIFNFFGAMASKVMSIPMRVCKSHAEADALIVHLAPDLAESVPSYKPVDSESAAQSGAS